MVWRGKKGTFRKIRPSRKAAIPPSERATRSATLLSKPLFTYEPNCQPNDPILLGHHQHIVNPSSRSSDSESNRTAGDRSASRHLNDGIGITTNADAEGCAVEIDFRAVKREGGNAGRII